MMVTAVDVIHSWAVPSLGVKVDAIPGRLNQLGYWLMREGVFYGQCSEICGSNHAFMPIALEGGVQRDYHDWFQGCGYGWHSAFLHASNAICESIGTPRVRVAPVRRKPIHSYVFAHLFSRLLHKSA